MSKSENHSSSNLDSNARVITELTRDLENQVNINETQNNENIVLGKNIEHKENSNVPEDFEESDNEEKKNPDLGDDYIDEQLLEDQEKSLTKEEKLERHKQALEHKNNGNDQFKTENYIEAIHSYTEGLRICPLMYTEDRSILYANRAASKAKIDRKKSAIQDCTKSIELNNKYLKAYLRRAKLYEETDDLDKSLEDYKKMLEFDPGNQEALGAQVRLPPLINERNEKLKEEMLGKLKDLGNVILRPFGLSTNNFKLTQDPNSGGYSVNFQQNPQ